MLRSLAVVGVLLTMLALGSAQTKPPEGLTKPSSVHPLSGTWTLNLGKSKYDPPGLTPKKATVRFVIAQEQASQTVDSVDSQGRAMHSEWTGKFDGKDYPWKGTLDGQPNPNQDAIVARKIDDHTYELINKLRGQVLTTQRLVVAPDGKSRVTTTTGKNALGQVVHNVAFYDRQ